MPYSDRHYRHRVIVCPFPMQFMASDRGLQKSLEVWVSERVPIALDIDGDPVFCSIFLKFEIYVTHLTKKEQVWWPVTGSIKRARQFTSGLAVAHFLACTLRKNSFNVKYLENGDRYDVGVNKSRIGSRPWAIDWRHELWPCGWPWTVVVQCHQNCRSNISETVRYDVRVNRSRIGSRPSAID